MAGRSDRVEECVVAPSHKLAKDDMIGGLDMEIHIVQPGETVYGIAGRYGVDPELLRLSNGVPADGTLAVGQTLVVQQVQTFHVVQPGETLTSVARRYGVTLRSLYRNNFWLEGSPAILAGDVLVITYAGEKLGGTYTNGYAYPFIRQTLLSSTLPYMSQLTPFTYGIDAAGGLLPLDDGELLSEARRLGTAPLMHLSTLTEDGHFSSERAVMILTDSGLRYQLIRQIVETISRKGYQGLDVDFEYIPPRQREDYARFIRELRAQLAPSGLPVVVALAPKTNAQQRGLLYEAHDQVLDYAVTEIPREKIYLGVPYYGYDWPLPFRQGETRARSLSNQAAVDLAVARGADIQYDETSQAPWFHYTAEDGTTHEVWFEDARSLSAKLRLIREYGLHGAGYWSLMRPYPQGWTLLNALYDVLDA